jgi:hypothetical protein
MLGEPIRHKEREKRKNRPWDRGEREPTIRSSGGAITQPGSTTKFKRKFSLYKRKAL